MEYFGNFCPRTTNTAKIFDSTVWIWECRDKFCQVMLFPCHPCGWMEFWEHARMANAMHISEVVQSYIVCTGYFGSLWAHNKPKVCLHEDKVGREQDSYRETLFSTWCFYSRTNCSQPNALHDQTCKQKYCETNLDFKSFWQNQFPGISMTWSWIWLGKSLPGSLNWNWQFNSFLPKEMHSFSVTWCHCC